MPGRPSELEYVEKPLLKQLESLGWTVLSLNDRDKHDPEKSFRSSLAEVIIVKKLKEALARLNPWLNAMQIDDLCTQLQNYTYPMDKLLENNIEIFDRIVEGLSADNEDTGEVNCPVRIIDWSDTDTFNKTNTNNEFLAISQFKIRIPAKEEHIIPDVLLFVNGLPLVVVECKAPDISEPIAEGIEQLFRYQNRRNAPTPEGVTELFFYNQFVISTSFHSTRYTSITGNGSHFIEWKDPYPYKLSDVKENGVPSSQEILVAGMLEPSHLLDIIRNYIVFIEDDEGRTIKIVPRYMQYRGVRKIIERLRKEQAGGTLWHTQGSGKSLTMMFVIRKMFNSSDLHNYKIVLLIDRKELQSQLFKTTKAIKYVVNEADSIEGLKKLIRNTASDVTVAMVHKFGDRGEKGAKFPVLNESDRILVMIDEAHRSEYNDLAANMWRSMPKSVKVAFTGTPIVKTTDTFGGYIDTYTMNQAVNDEVVVEIKYEGRATDSKITDSDAMNKKFVDVFGLIENDEQKLIMDKYTARGYLEALEVIHEKASDMLDHYINTVFCNGFKAQVVAVSKEAAYRYNAAIMDLLPQKIAQLEKNNPNNIDINKLRGIKTSCIISCSPNDEPHLKAFSVDVQNEIIVDGFKAPFGSQGKNGGDGNYGIITVTAMLMTGFDAPIEQVLYLDKVLKNHTLLQAIARVNRTCGSNKKCGYVVDYVGITNHLREALSDYTDEDFDETVSSMKDNAQDIDSLNNAYNNILWFISEKINAGSIEDTNEVIEELVADDKLREEFNALFTVLSKLYDRVLPNPAALEYMNTFRLLAFIRESVAKLTRDQRFSMRDASKKVRAIIEEYLAVNGVSLEIEPISILSEDFLDDSKKKAKSDRAVCDEIKYAVRQYINVNMQKDPELYARLSDKLEALLEEFKNNWATLRESLENIREEIIEGRQREKTYGYEPDHEMPFFALLKQELYGNKGFADLKEDDFNALKDLTNDVLERFKTDTKVVNFWNNESKQKTLRTHIITQLITPEIKQRVPDVFNKRKEIAQKLLELGFQHYKGNSI